jgi:hypothetical protein
VKCLKGIILKAKGDSHNDTVDSLLPTAGESSGIHQYENRYVSIGNKKLNV